MLKQLHAKEPTRQCQTSNIPTQMNRDSPYEEWFIVMANQAGPLHCQVSAFDRKEDAQRAGDIRQTCSRISYLDCSRCTLNRMNSQKHEKTMPHHCSTESRKKRTRKAFLGQRNRQYRGSTSGTLTTLRESFSIRAGGLCNGYAGRTSHTNEPGTLRATCMSSEDFADTDAR